MAAPAAAQVQSKERVNPYYLSFGPQSVSVPARIIQVERVLDGRGGRVPIGMIYRGLYDKQAPVLFRNSLEEELTTWLRQQLPGRPTDHAVVLCVRRLQVDEIVQGYNKGALATADLVADVYVRQPDGYHFVRNVAAHTSGRGIGANADHAAHLAAAMQSCLGQLAEVDWTQAARMPVRTLAQLATDKTPAPAKPAILRAAKPRRGVYRTWEQFLNNRPDTTISVRVDTLGANALAVVFDPKTPAGNTRVDWKGTALLKAKMRAANGERLPEKEIWGFSDGRQAYVRQISTYRPLTRQAGFFTFVGAAPVDVTAANQRARNAVMGAMMGISPAYASGPDGMTGRPVIYALDLRSGQAALYPPPGQPLRADTAFVYVYRPVGGTAGPQRVLLNDHEVGQLKPGEYLELAWAHTERPMRLSVGTPGGPALLAAPSTATANYVKLVANSTASPWQWMPIGQGEADVDALEKPRKP